MKPKADGYFDPEQRRREKQAERAKDCAEIEQARIERREPRLANGVFDALDLRNALIIYPESGRKA